MMNIKLKGILKAKNRYKNKKSLSKIQTRRLENYSEELMKVLEKYANEIEASILAYNKKSCEETMMIKGLRKSSQETTNRKTHMENVEGIAVQIAEKLGLNVGVTRIIARNHDIGHTFLGHSGEWWISNAKEDAGIGYSVHNAIGPRELIYTNGIYDEILSRIKEFNPKISNKELKRIRKSLWLIFDGINSHNGEKTESEFIPNTSKTEADFIEELKNCFTIKGFDRTIMPASIEGALIRLCDKISYIPSDMLDGLREGIIDKIDGEYIKVLTELGITEEEIEECNIKRNWDKIARRLQITFTKDVITNSSKGAIRMSPEISKLMHELRNINNRRIVNYVVLKEDNDTYPKAIRSLMNLFAEVLIHGGVFDKLDNISKEPETIKKLLEECKGTYAEDFIKYVTKTSPEDMEFTRDIIYRASRQSIKDEQEKARSIVLSGEKFEKSEEFPRRDTRIKEYIDYYRSIGLTEDYTEEEIEQDIEKEIKKQCKEERIGDYNHPSMKMKIALEMAAKYLTSLNDIEFFNLLKESGKISEEQAKSLTRKYKDIGPEGLKKEVYEQTEWKTIRDTQQEETEKAEEEGPEL